MRNLVILSDTPKETIEVSRQDLMEIMTCLLALIWLEEPRGEIFQRKAERLIEKYQPNA